MPKSPEGILTAVVTPFNADESIAYSSWKRVIELLIANEVDGIFLLGGGGEFYTLNEAERKESVKFAADTVRGRIPIYTNVGAVTTREALSLARHAESVGSDYLVLVTPYYIRPSADELVEHYSEVCRSVRIPVFAYNMPGRTGVELTAAVVRRIAAANKNFAGLKDSSGKLELLPDWVAIGGAVFMGSDHLIQPALDRGCAGAVTVCSNVAPRLFVDLFRAWKRKDTEETTRLQALAAELRLALRLSSFRSLVKDAMNLSGIPVGQARRPAGTMTEEERADIVAVLDKLKAANYLAEQIPAY